MKKKNASNITLMRNGDVTLQVARTDIGYHIALTSKDSYSMKHITKKTHDLLIKALVEEK